MINLRPKSNGQAYKWGQDLIESAQAGDGGCSLSDGWAKPERNICWTVDHLAKVSLTTRDNSMDRKLSLACIPYVGEGKIEAQELNIYVNGNWATFAKLYRAGKIVCDLPASFFKNGVNIISIALPGAASPHSLGIGPDKRRLGIAVSSMSLS